MVDMLISVDAVHPCTPHDRTLNSDSNAAQHLYSTSPPQFDVGISPKPCSDSRSCHPTPTSCKWNYLLIVGSSTLQPLCRNFRPSFGRRRRPPILCVIEAVPSDVELDPSIPSQAAISERQLQRSDRCDGLCHFAKQQSQCDDE